VWDDLDEALKDAGVDRVLLFPQYPHYAMSSWETVVVKTRREAAAIAPSMRIESVGNANHQAALVAAAMMARPEPLPFVPWFWSDQYGGRLQIAGLWQSADRWVERQEGVQGRSIWSYQGPRLVAVDAWQAPVAYALGKKWLETGQYPPAEWLDRQDQNLKDWVPQAASGVTV
jgi:hypothetical protein